MATPSSDHHPWAHPVKIDIRTLLAEDKAKFASTRRLNPSVFRVPTYVRKLKPDIYEAGFLPMGLLYNKEFKGMSSIYQLKLEVLGCFLELLKVDEDNWDTFCKDVATQPPDSNTPNLENFYDHNGISSFPTLESMEPLLVTDAFFIVGLFIWSKKSRTDGADISGSDHRPRFIKRLKQIFHRGGLGSSLHALDLDICWLYEGQIPLFLVKNAWEKVASAPQVKIPSFAVALKENLDRILTYSDLAFHIFDPEVSNFDDCDHLLACVQKSLSWTRNKVTWMSRPTLPSIKAKEEEDEDKEVNSEEKEQDDSSNGKKEDEVIAEYEKDKGNVNGEEEKDQEPRKDEKDEENGSTSGEEEDDEETDDEEEDEGRFKSYIRKIPIAKQILELAEKLMAVPDTYIRCTLPSATQLASTGIRFKRHNDFFGDVELRKSFFRLSATVYLARINVTGFTETMLLNTCVYESMNRKDDGVHSYLQLMDELIDTEQDVELLMDGDDPVIMENLLGDNKQVVSIFTNPVQNMYFVEGYTSRRFEDIRWDLIHWYSNPWRRRVVQFLDSYRVAPWLVVSLLAAIFLLVLTVLQTIYTIWGFYGS